MSVSIAHYFGQQCSGCGAESLPPRRMKGRESFLLASFIRPAIREFVVTNLTAISAFFLAIDIEFKILITKHIFKITFPQTTETHFCQLKSASLCTIYICELCSSICIRTLNCLSYIL